ncbi:hypothetical protein [Haloglycomyces albus]|uniref:hypothetical protein n=1 Tax=Haloglycomyces albus TaxID=526067 RepID=UPI00046CB07E|nr:hypothetical protein [Haloglycomyces albus]
MIDQYVEIIVLANIVTVLFLFLRLTYLEAAPDSAAENSPHHSESREKTRRHRRTSKRRAQNAVGTEDDSSTKIPAFLEDVIVLPNKHRRNNGQSLGRGWERIAPQQRTLYHPRRTCWAGQQPATGPVIARVGFLARTIELRQTTIKSAQIVAVEPGGAEMTLGSIAWNARCCDHIEWSDDPARHSLIGNGTLDQYWLDQRLRATVENIFHDRPYPTRFADPRKEAVQYADQLSTV